MLTAYSMRSSLYFSCHFIKPSLSLGRVIQRAAISTRRYPGAAGTNGVPLHQRERELVDQRQIKEDTSRS